MSELNDPLAKLVEPVTSNVALSDTDSSTVLPLESFNEEELNAVKRLKEVTGVAGILIGALRGAALGDIRPLIQSGSTTVLLRSVPVIENNASRTDVLRAVLGAWHGSNLAPPGFSWGEDDSSKRIWITRRWYDPGYEPSVSETEFAGLTSSLLALHDAGIGHGHLLRSNLAREGTSIVVLDPGLFAFELAHKGGENSAPEPDPRALDLRCLVEIAPLALQARVQSAITTGRLSSLTAGFKPSTKSKQTRPDSAATSQAIVPRSHNTQLHGTQTHAAPAAAGGGFWDSRILLTTLVGATVLAGAGIAGNWYLSQREIIPIADAVQLLASGQPSLMAQVAEAAIDGQKSAQALIVKATSEGKISDQLAKRKLLTLAFDPRWEAELSNNDREIALRLGLAKLYPEGLKDPPSLSAIHPGVLLAVIADIDEARPAQFADRISLEGFSSLPGDVGLSFKALSQAGVTSVADPSARALTRIIGGSDAERDIQLVLSGKGAGARLRALVPVFNSQPKLSRATLSYIAGSSGVLTELLRWLGSDISVGWSKSPPEKILGILAGNPPGQLSLEQWADLLSFPEPSIRRSAAVTLSQNFLRDEAAIVTLLASSDTGLTRSQVSILVSALGLPAAERDTLLSRWFDLKPNPEAIKQILLVRSKAAVNDTLNLEAARALNGSEVRFSNPELRRLTQYKEPLVRALAYSKLTADDPEQRKILEESTQQEVDQKLRNGLLERVSDYERTQAALSK